MDTIFAVSSGRPPAGIAVLRISGPDAFAAARALGGTLPPPREGRVRSLRDSGGALLDRALVLTFPGPASATGEDVAELHCHGGRAVVEAVSRALADLPGLRAAEPGEFTRRALINGRIDLAEAEGLADLLAAETERQRVAALAAAEGRISTAVRGWLDRIALLAARIEATLDFSDEGDVGSDDTAGVTQDMQELADEIDAIVAAPAAERLRDGIRVVLGGPPNSGKSTLVNAMADRDAAIVSPISGTTRDRIEVPVARAGMPFVLVDVAGLTETADEIERIGVERARTAIDTADIVLWLGDDEPPPGAVWVFPRADQPGREIAPEDRLAVSRNDPFTIERLWRTIELRADWLVPGADQLTLNRRQREACATAAQALRTLTHDPLLIAEELRGAVAALGSVLGINATEAMLDALFGRFCIGK